jgi:hypothetical protein
MKNRLSVITRGDEELGVLSGRGLGIINIHRTKKRMFLLLRVILHGEKHVVGNSRNAQKRHSA